MGARLRRAIAIAIALAAGTGCAHAHPGPPLAVAPVGGLPRSAASHVAVVMMENEEGDEVLGSRSAPYVNALAVHSNIADPQYGTFFGNYQLRHRADFDVLF